VLHSNDKLFTTFLYHYAIVLYYETDRLEQTLTRNQCLLELEIVSSVRSNCNTVNTQHLVAWV